MALKGQPIRAAIRAAREVTYDPIPQTDGLLSTVYNVELCAVGIEYPLASGPATFTPEDLVEAVASQDDPAIQAPRVWLGHPDDQRFHAGRTTPAGSAEPALGKVVNMRVEDEGMTLVGDIVGCPTWLARILSSAYPNRSIEGFQGAQTVTGHEWSLVVTDLALLGVVWPGVSTLDDLQALYSEDGPEGIEVKEDEELTVTAARSVTAQVNVDDIRRAYYDSLEGEQMWWWIRAIQLDPNELIVDDDEGGLYRVPFEIKGEEVTFGEAAQVKIKYVNASQAKDPAARGLLVNMLTAGKTVAASYDQRAASRPATDTQEESSMTPEQIRLLRARLGLSEEQLPDNATQDQINAALSAPAADETQRPPAENPENPSPDQTPGGGDDGGNTEEEDKTGEQNKEPAGVAASAQLPAGMVAVPAEAWASMQTSVQTLSARREAETKDEDKRLLAEAVRAGKVFPAQQAYYAQRLEDKATRDTFRHLLTASVAEGGLAPNLVPVTARGVDPSDTELSASAYPADWLPEVQHRTDSNIIQEA